ncbi:ras guanine nucleotide exchange factor domain-containing protein [Sporodiniella umbellata]|nr:ras guanine nucleotide exchange factor domain-containing protein [Sporodiniella umbellata]
MVLKQKLVDSLDLHPIRDYIDTYRFKGDEQKVIELSCSKDIPKNADSFYSIFVCYDTTSTENTSKYTRLVQVPCLLVGFQNQTITTLSLDNHTFFHADTHRSERKAIYLLNHQLYHVLSTGTFFKYQRYSPTPHQPVQKSSDTPFDIVHQIIYCEQDPKSMTIFLMLYRKFMTPIQLLQQLINHFQQSPSHQTKITNILIAWLHTYWGDFHHFSTRHLLQDFLESVPHKIYDRLEPFVFREPAKEDPDLLWALSEESVRKTDSGYYDEDEDDEDDEDEIEQDAPMVRRSISSLSSSARCLPKRYSAPTVQRLLSTQLTDAQQLTRIPVKKMAQQLSFLEMDLFLTIQPRDFLRHVWVHPKKRSTISTTLSASIQHFNYLSEWIASMILSQVELDQRVLVYEYCSRLAIELEQLNNFNSLMATLAGLNSASILRLKETRQRVADRHQVLVDTVSRLEKLMSSDRSFCNYRHVLKQKSHTPVIPYLGVHQQDLVSLAEANKDHRINGRIHWQKFLLIGNSILDVLQFQNKRHDWILPDPFVLYFIKHELQILTEDERYEQSMKIEPKQIPNSKSLHSSSTSRWLMLKEMIL